MFFPFLPTHDSLLLDSPSPHSTLPSCWSRTFLFLWTYYPAVSLPSLLMFCFLSSLRTVMIISGDAPPPHFKLLFQTSGFFFTVKILDTCRRTQEEIQQYVTMDHSLRTTVLTISISHAYSVPHSSWMKVSAGFDPLLSTQTGALQQRTVKLAKGLLRPVPNPIDFSGSLSMN